ncbi:hypothetical protein JXB37_00805 [candidate division WOR-3 bacterium]|nr:hypothetical protein [candidate division WOR-3 bacterium]
MKRMLFLLVLSVVCVPLAADTLDFSRYTAVVTVTESRNIEVMATDRLADRAREVIRRSAWDRDYTVADFLAAHTKYSNRFDRMTFDSYRGETKFRSDGGLTVDFEYPLAGSVLELLLPEPGEARLLGRVACPCCGQEWPEGREVPDGVALVPLEDENTPQYTGILVDARGLGWQPALFPRVVTRAGAVAAGPEFASRRELAERGLVGLYPTRNDALMGDRTGSNPLVVRALDIAGYNGCDLVVSDEDAARIHGSKLNIQHLAECRVGFLVD